MKSDDVLIWLGSQGSAIEYVESIERAHRMAERNPELIQANSFSAKVEQQERFGSYGDFIHAQGNVAIVPIQGSLQARETWFSRMLGIMSYDSLSNIMAEIVADGGIDTVVMDIDSPGGAAKGVDTAIDGIRAAQAHGIEVVAHTSGQMASAAYWLGSTADTVAATESAEVGSVGVIAVHAEQSERLKEDGIGVTVLRKGEEKALATPYEKLSVKGRDQVLESMERSYSSFINAVAESRELSADYVREKIATGAVFGSQEAVQMGMIDEIVTYNDLVSRYVSKAGPSEAGHHNGSVAAMHKQPIINAGGIMSPEDAAIAVAAGADPESVRPLLNAQGEEAGEQSQEELAEVTVVEGDEESPEENSEGAEGTGTPADKAGLSAEAAGLQSLVANLNEQLVEARVANASLKAEVDSLSAGNAGLRQVTVQQTQRLRISMGQPGGTQDLDAMSDLSLVQAHNAAMTSFMERFNIGPTSKEAESDPTPEAHSTKLSEAARRLTRIK